MAPYTPQRRPRFFYGWVVVAGGFLNQVLNSGLGYQGFGTFLLHLEREFGWSKAEITGAFTLSLLVSGLAGVSVGSILDRFGGRWLMTSASTLGVLALVGASFTDSLITYYGIWIGIGLITAATLYPSGFAVTVATLGNRGRQGVTLMTLIAGFASTIFIPLINKPIKFSYS